MISYQNLNIKNRIRTTLSKLTILLLFYLLQSTQSTNHHLFPSIYNEIYDVNKQKETFLTFTFDQENNKLLIKTQSQFIQYSGYFQSNPWITFDQIKKVLAERNYKIISIDNRSIQIMIAGVINLQLKSQDQINIEFLKDVIQKLTVKVQKETQKKNQLQLIVKEMQNNITTLAAQLIQLKSQFDQQTNQAIQKSLAHQKELFKQSRVVNTNEEKIKIEKFFQKKTIKSAKLIYRAIENDFSLNKFHQNCDGIANTMTLIRTSTLKKIGGFTPLQWSSHPTGLWVVDESKESFIFSLTNNDKFTLQQPQYAIYNIKNQGPSFGRGFDLYLNEKSSQRQSAANIYTSYRNQGYQHNNKASWEKFKGSKDSYFYTTLEWQVWELKFV